MLTDGRGRPLRFILTPGQAADIKSAPALIEGMRAGGVIADKGYDSNAFRDLIKSRKMKVVIPSNRSRKRLRRYDKDAYKSRNRIERCFNKLKHFRRISTRFDRLDVYFMAWLHLASVILWTR